MMTWRPGVSTASRITAGGGGTQFYADPDHAVRDAHIWAKAGHGSRVTPLGIPKFEPVAIDGKPRSQRKGWQKPA